MIERVCFLPDTFCHPLILTAIFSVLIAGDVWYFHKREQHPKLRIMNPTIQQYNDGLSLAEKAICDVLSLAIDNGLPDAESKIWHGHPVWFLEGNPIVGYSLEKSGVRLMFWSGADFEEERLVVRGTKFKDASIYYKQLEEVDTTEIQRWLEKSRDLQWDYKNLVKRKGRLERLK